MRSLSEHLSEPNFGAVDQLSASAEGHAGGSCGVVSSFVLDVRNGIIVDCAARVRGRAVAFAAASALAEAARGRTVIDAARLGLSTLHTDFAELDDESLERARVVEDAFHHTIGVWFTRAMERGEQVPLDGSAPRVAVAMSGGVDSAIALHAAIDSSQIPIGVTLRLWIDPQAPDPDSACCAPDSVRRARRTCHAMGLPHVSLDLRQGFLRSVVAPFVASYQAGETPNPCVRCNGDFRLDQLVQFADVCGADTVVTGHYARTVERDGVTLLQRGVDLRKDQSYMLATMDPATLARFRFPLGATVKTDNVARAERLGLEQADVRESQDVCFLGGGDYRGFLARADALGPSGAVRLEDGTQVGAHRGIAAFTPGQRRGLAMDVAQAPDGGPLYVLRTDPADGSVVVGARDRLRTETVMLRDARMLDTTVTRANVRLRYRGMAGGWASIEWGPDGGATLTFDEPVVAPAPGQMACLYDADEVIVGSGTIARRTLDEDGVRSRPHPLASTPVSR